MAQLDDKALRRMLLEVIAKCPTVGLLLPRIELRLEPSESLPFAYGWTDGKTIALRDDLNPSEAEAVFWHEVLHIVNSHISRAEGREAELWNIAADVWVNHTLSELGLQLPPNSVKTPPFIIHPEQLSVEEIYSELHKRAQQVPRPSPQRTDQHRDWGKGAGKQGDKQGDSQQAQGEVKRLTEKELEELRRRMAEDFRRLQGEVPAGWQRELSQVQGQMSWREALQRFISNTVQRKSMLPPARKTLVPIATLPVRQRKYPRIVVAVDTSGSIQPSELNQFIAEVKSIFSVLKSPLTLIACDAEVHDEVDIASVGDLVQLTGLKGGGGTDFRPVFKRIGEMDEPVAGLVYFTDTFGTYPDTEPEYPVLWVVPAAITHIQSPPFGEVIQLGGD